MQRGSSQSFSVSYATHYHLDECFTNQVFYQEILKSNRQSCNGVLRMDPRTSQIKLQSECLLSPLLSPPSQSDASTSAAMQMRQERVSYIQGQFTKDLSHYCPNLAHIKTHTPESKLETNSGETILKVKVHELCDSEFTNTLDLLKVPSEMSC